MNKKTKVQSSEQTPIKERLEFEKLLADISARFVALPFDCVDAEILDALKKLTSFFRIDACGLMKLQPGKTLFRVSHGFDATGSGLVPIGVDLPVSIYPWVSKRLMEPCDYVSFSRPEDLPEEAAIDKRNLVEWKIASALYIPIAAVASSEYTIAINSLSTHQTWPEEYIPRLRMLGEIFVNALEKSRVESTLRDSEERLGLAAYAAGAGLWTIDTDSGFIWATPKFRELFQFKPDEELNFELHLRVVHPDDRKRVRELVQQAMQRQEPLNIEYRITLADGASRWISTTGKITGQPPCFMGVSVDITERKLMETELQKRLEENQRLKLQLEKENIYLREERKVELGFGNLIGSSDALQYVLFRARQFAPTDAIVLILGETGVGKGMVANAIHEMSARKDRPMVVVNCAALPASLIESELFGREKGAFTGAHARQVGRFEIADGGTIFLDEIGELPLELQSKLLRVLQDGEFERLGSPVTIRVDVRVIASTSRDLKSEVRNGRFREDLYYRLNVFPVSIPPLRARGNDIRELAEFFIDKYSRKYGRKFTAVAADVMRTLGAYHWPGNVRELEHVIERAVITSAGEEFKLIDQFEHEPVKIDEGSLKGYEAMAREYILQVLQKTRWKIEGEGGAAAILGLNPSTLRFRIKRLGIKRN